MLRFLQSCSCNHPFVLQFPRLNALRLFNNGDADVVRTEKEQAAEVGIRIRLKRARFNSILLQPLLNLVQIARRNR